MATVLDHFDALTQRGLKIIPVRQNSKVPLCKGWTRDWDLNVYRHKLRQFPDSNIGILLGDVVDVEGDSDHANRLIEDLIGDYPHPVYRSTKSFHHLFLNPDQTLRHFRHGDIEFRGHGHQSVLPPSRHHGVVYQWLKKFKFPVPPMPERLVEFYHDRRYGRGSGLKPGHVKLWCGLCSKECYLHEKRFALELRAFGLLGRKWQCHCCRLVDLRPACRLIRSGCPDELVLESLGQ